MSANPLSIRTIKVQFCSLRMARHPAGVALVTSTFAIFVNDRVASSKVKIEHCPTKDMMADFFTKPLQGALFLKMRNKIMNVNPLIDYGSEDCRSVLNLVSKDTVGTDGTVGTDKGTDKHVTDDVRIIVESKQERKAKRLQSCMNTGKTRSVSRMNGRSGFRVKFGDSSDGLILINFPIYKLTSISQFRLHYCTVV